MKPIKYETPQACNHCLGKMEEGYPLGYERVCKDCYEKAVKNALAEVIAATKAKCEAVDTFNKLRSGIGLFTGSSVIVDDTEELQDLASILGVDIKEENDAKNLIECTAATDGVDFTAYRFEEVNNETV